jgi:Family of unknown function (DUF5330)
MQYRIFVVFVSASANRFKFEANADHSNFLKKCGVFALNMEKNADTERTRPSSLPARLSSHAVEQAAGNQGRFMRFLLKMAFWLGLVLVLLPSVGSEPAPKTPVNASDAMSAAKAAAGDLRQFCERQADACTIGSQAAVALGHRAQAGAKMLYEFLNDQLGPADTGTVAIGAGKPVPTPTARPSQHTLMPTDLAPTWRGPQPPRNNEPPA